MRYDYSDLIALNARARRERAEAVFALVKKIFALVHRTQRLPARPHRPAAA